VENSVKIACKTIGVKNWNPPDGDCIFVLQLGCGNPSKDESISTKSIRL